MLILDIKLIVIRPCFVEAVGVVTVIYLFNFVFSQLSQCFYHQLLFCI